jgi:hypothetical protein
MSRVSLFMQLVKITIEGACHTTVDDQPAA